MISETETPERTRWIPLVVEAAILAVAGSGLALASARGWTSASAIEVFGFITGGACVWLGVRGSIWNWPIGLSNNIAFLILFWKGRLYADAALQVVFFSLGVYGWFTWLRGGEERSSPPVTRALRIEWILLAIASPFLTWGLREWLIVAGGAAPFWDALTAVISLGEQYLMCRKRVECWILWMIVDVIYVPLYLSRDLPLTAVLYGVFLVMCGVGLRAWSLEYAKGRGES